MVTVCIKIPLCQVCPARSDSPPEDSRHQAYLRNVASSDSGWSGHLLQTGPSESFPWNWAQSTLGQFGLLCRMPRPHCREGQSDRETEGRAQDLWFWPLRLCETPQHLASHAFSLLKLFRLVLVVRAPVALRLAFLVVLDILLHPEARLPGATRKCPRFLLSLGMWVSATFMKVKASRA